MECLQASVSKGGRAGLTTKNSHSAEDAALGFLYQAQYALVLLWHETDDDAVVYLRSTTSFSLLMATLSWSNLSTL
jgi:hypothetical protein